MEVLKKGNSLIIKDEDNEILIGAVDGERFDKLFQTMKLMDAEYKIKVLGKPCPHCGRKE